MGPNTLQTRPLLGGPSHPYLLSRISRPLLSVKKSPFVSSSVSKRLMTSFPQPSLYPIELQGCEACLHLLCPSPHHPVPACATHPTGIGPTVHSSSRCRCPGYRRTTWEHQAEKFWCTSCTKAFCRHVGMEGKCEPILQQRWTLPMSTPTVNFTKAYVRVNPTNKNTTHLPHLPRHDAHTSHFSHCHMILECGVYACCLPLPHLPSIKQDPSWACGYLK